MQLPSIGRIVHYTNLGDKDGKYPPEVQAAIVTGVYYASPQPSRATGVLVPDVGPPGAPANGTTDKPSSMFVDLKILYRTGEFSMRAVPYSESPDRGHWNWPPRI